MPSLMPHQEKAVAESPDRWSLWFRMRVGKTPTAIRLADSRASSALVICPKSLREQWRAEIARWSDGKCRFTVISKEEMRTKFSSLPHHEAVIVDEAHMAFGNHRSKTFKAMLSYLKRHRCRYVWLLSGTPYTSSPWCVYSYGILLGKDWSWKKWEDEFFAKVRMGPRMIPVPRKGKDAQLQSILRSIGTVVDLCDIADVPDDEDVVETFVLPKEVQSLRDQFVDPVAVVEIGKKHQFEQGATKGNDFEEGRVWDIPKDARVAEIIASEPKVAVVCRYLAQVDKIVRICNKLKKTCYIISGQTGEEAGITANRANNTENCVVVIQADTCAGYSLASFGTMVFASMSYSFVNYDQMRSRIKSATRTEPCRYVHLLTEGDSIDRAVYDCVMRKQDFSAELYANKWGRA